MGLDYLLEMNVTGLTNAWVLGVSQLGAGTVLQPTFVVGGVLATIPGVLSGSIRRGRADELSTIDAGTMTLILDNADGRFSPDYISSPYYPNMNVMRQVRLSARIQSSDSWTPLFYGHVESIVPHDSDTSDSNVELTATDWLARASLAPITGPDAVRPAEADQARFFALVNTIGTEGMIVNVVGTPENVDNLIAKDYTGVLGLTALQEITANTFGTIFQMASGVLVYWTRYGRWLTPGTFDPTWVFDQVGLNHAANVVPYLPGMSYDLNLTSLFTQVVVNGPGAVAEAALGQADDITAQHTYGTRTKTISANLLSDKCTGCLADSLLMAYRQPYARIHAITVPVHASPTGGSAWAGAVLGLDLGNRVHVTKSQPGNMSIDHIMRVESINHTWDGEAKTHLTQLGLSDERAMGPAPWILGTTPLDNGTVLVY